ncbi:MAG: DegQ family serine endoprotease [Dongiaceae bacterium]
MRSILLAALLAVGVVSSSLAAPPPLTTQPPVMLAPNTFADLADKLSPAVVNVSTTQIVKPRQPGEGMPQFQFPPGSPFEEFFKEFFDRLPDNNNNQPQQESRPRSKPTSLGSGFIIDPSGLIVTNNHVIADADEIRVTLHDDTKLKAEIVGRDIKTDLALLRVKADKKLPYVSFGNSDVARVGEWILAIGNPFGLGGTVTQGIISARQRDINAGPYDDFIQTDAPINRGNSGGPMFNLKGEVIGINTAIFSPSGGSVGIGFAIPSNLAKPVIDQLRDFGRTKRGWLGVRIQTVSDEIAETLGLKGAARGALVAGVTPKGPAETAGLESGDIILKFNGKDVPEMRRLPRMVADTPVGQSVEVVVWRKGKERTLSVKIAQLDETEESKVASSGSDKKSLQPEKDKSTKVLGMALSPLSDNLRKRFDVRAGVNGVVVIAVDGNAQAAELGIRSGDVILEAGQEPVKSVEDFEAKVKKANAEKRKSILLLLQRADDMRFVALRLSDK